MSHPHRGIYISFTVILAISTLVSILLFIYSIHTTKQKNKLLTWTFICMLMYLLGQISCVGHFIEISIDNNRITILYILFLFFYLISLLLMLAVFIGRIVYSFQSTMFKYSQKTINILYGLYICIVIWGVAALTLVMTLMFVTSLIVLWIMFMTCILFGVFVLLLSTTLLVLFIKKLLQLQQYDDNTKNVTESQDLFDKHKMLKFQLKLTTLVLISVISTSMLLGLSIVANRIGVQLNEALLGEFIARVMMYMDFWIGFITMALTLNQNEIFYDKYCTLCAGCVSCCLYGFISRKATPNNVVVQFSGKKSTKKPRETLTGDSIEIQTATSHETSSQKQIV